MSENKSKNENDEEQKKQRQKSAGKNKQGKKGEKFGRITTSKKNKMFNKILILKNYFLMF